MLQPVPPEASVGTECKELQPSGQTKVYWAPPQTDLADTDTAWSKLYLWRSAEATKPFLARGHRIQRCGRCLLKPCFCPHRVPSQSDCDFLLVFHRNEVLKPTNTGRLIADCFPTNTWACTWHRNQIPKPLTELLGNPLYQPVLVFPGEQNPQLNPTQSSADGKRLLLIALDGTWKQARKMYLQSPWLHHYPAVKLSNQQLSNYGLRQAPVSQQLATVEATSQALSLVAHNNNAAQLTDYFRAFTKHYQAMRSNQHQPGQ